MVTPAVAAGPRVYRVVAFRSIAGVRLGEREAAVRRRLGRPYKTIDSGVGITDVFWNRSPHLDVEFSRRGRVTVINAYVSRYRLPWGLGTGSSERAVRRAYPHARCDARREGCMVVRGDRSMTFAFRVGGGRRPDALSGSVNGITLEFGTGV